MVMRRKNMMRRNLSQTIRHSLGRYIAIVAIIALGAGLFCGLRVTKVDMVATVQQYTDEQNMFDLQVMNSYGWTDDDVFRLSQVEGIADVEGSISLDALIHLGDNEDRPYKLISIPQTVNRVSLDAGRMPTAPDECLADGFFMDDSIVGKQIYISAANTEQTLDALKYDTYTVVGLTSTPLYLNIQRGSTSIGSGALSTYFYIPKAGFDQEIYTEINLTLQGDYRVYTDEYDDAMDAMAERLEEVCQPLADQRLANVRAEAEEEYADGLAEYNDGLAEFQDAKAEALEELDKAEAELLDAEKELADNRKLLEDGLVQMDEAVKTLDESEAAIVESRLTLANAKAEAYAQLSEAGAELMRNYKEVLSAKQQVDDGLRQIDAGMIQLESGMTQLESGLALVEMILPILETGVQTCQQMLDAAIAVGADEETLAPLEEALAEATAKYDEYSAQYDELLATQAELDAQYAQLTQQRDELIATQSQLEDAIAAIELGFLELEQSQRTADNQFAAAEAQIDAGELQIQAGREELEKRRVEAEEGLMLLEEGEQELAEGKKTFAEEKAKALKELDNAEAELADAKSQLADARETIDDMTESTVYALTRNTNLGYVVFESDSDIVAGVAKIFPVFFLSVAALVCITTMTRMIDEERTQIGVLKALGYSSRAIMGKYLGYSGSAAFTGCCLGLLLGCTFFPQVIWFAYCIMYNFSPQLTLSYDIGTFAFIFLSYTGLTLLVTWYCCRRELKEVPAELIRPKAPAAGKALFFENMGFWKKLKFLDKVAIRNIFRYRQRFLMMLLGIGGCTALLVTGFGLNDSISNIVNDQFEKITLFDISVTFDGGQTEAEQTAFKEEIRDLSDQVMFCYQGGIDVEFDGGVKNLNFLATDQDLSGFMDLHSGDEPVAMPGENEALISIGTSRSMGLGVGDTVTLRNSDLEELTVTVSGIFDNHVYNYCIISGSTMRSQWGRSPEEQSAFVLAKDGTDVHELGAAITGCDDVLNVQINQDTADQVNGMMDALDAIIILIVICAGLLAGIVLYNLTNINIKERIREIATIKVLGFNAGETASYVFKENLALTVFGTFVGLFAGKALHAVVMSYVRIDMVWFGNTILPMSYVWSAVLTILSAVLVDFVMYFQLEKINMAEALKSVE